MNICIEILNYFTLQKDLMTILHTQHHIVTGMLHTPLITTNDH